MSPVENNHIVHSPTRGNTPKAMRVTRRPRAQTYCSTVSSQESAALPERLHLLWDVWNVAHATPDSREARVEAARRAVQTGTLCLNPLTLAACLLQRSGTLQPHAVSAVPQIRL